jgi:Ser/Thr protein kinase RdoA (MazF antagonist)
MKQTLSDLDLAALCEHWNLSPVLNTAIPESGTIHCTRLLTTHRSRYALRAYRYSPNDRWRIDCEHALIAYVRERGVPAIAPLPLPSGETLLESEGRFYALFPFAPGSQVRRGEIGSAQAEAMGAALAKLHRVLADYPPERVPQRSLKSDLADTLAGIERIEQAIGARPQTDETDALVLRRLGERRAWLLATTPGGGADLTTLEQQVIHGDYQDTNLFFEQSRVSAIIDWDQSYVAPRAWEVVRALHYVFKFDTALCHAFIQAYRLVLSLSLEELDSAARAYSWKRAHDLWLYEELYLRDNRRVLAFLDLERHFTPVVELWVRIRPALQEMLE